MNNSYSIGDLMSLYYEREFAALEEAALPDFSAKHNRKMKKAFDVYSRNKALTANEYTAANRTLSARKRIVLAVIIIVLLAIATGCVIAFISDSFRGTVYSDNTYLFAFDETNCPKTIEKEYTLSAVPEGYELYRVVTAKTSVSTEYRNSDNQVLVFEQTVKSEFASHVNTEGHYLQETVINGCDGIYAEFFYDGFVESMVIWNNEYYILELSGKFDKDTLEKLAESNEICGF